MTGHSTSRHPMESHSIVVFGKEITPNTATDVHLLSALSDAEVTKAVQDELSAMDEQELS